MLLTIFLLIFTGFQFADSATLGSSRELEAVLFANYSKKWRPAMFKSQKTIVSLGLYIRDLNDVDEKQHTATIHGGLHMFWNDYRLKWDPSKFDSWYITVLPSRIWRPDWTVYNAFEPGGGETPYNPVAPYTQNHAWVYKDGSVSHYTVLSKTVTCVFDYSNFPFDSQRCKLVIGSWMYDYGQLDLQWANLRKLNINFQWLGSPTNRSRTSGWWMKEVTLKKTFFNDDTTTISANDPPPLTYDPSHLWPLLTAEFVLERHRPYFVLLELTPMLLASILTLMCFGIDSEIVATGVLFANLIVQGLCSWSIVNEMPSGGVGSTPKIIHAFGVCFGLTCSALLVHLILQRLRMLDKNSPIVVFITNLASKPWLSGFHAVNALKINSFSTDYQEIIELTHELRVARGVNLDQKVDNAIWTVKKIFLLIFMVAFFIPFVVSLL